MYLSYSEYENFGGSLDDAAFERYLFKAEGMINRYTLNRLVNCTDIPYAVKRVCYELINVYEKQDQALNVSGSISSQSNDGVSVSYSVMSPDSIYQNLENQVENIVKDGLRGVRLENGKSLLYRGIYPGE